MSRAFVREPDGDEVRLERPQRLRSDAPNYITPAGLAALEAHIEALRAERETVAGESERLDRAAALEGLDEELARLVQRRESAIPVPTPEPPWESVGVGATVELAGEDDERHRFTVVGEDETDVAAGRISWTSPLGRAVLRRSVGDVVTWRRPAGDVEIEILSIDYR